MGKSINRAPAAARKAAGIKSASETNKVNLLDGAALKRALDEAVAEVILAIIGHAKLCQNDQELMEFCLSAQALTSSGYRENHFVSNVKIGISLFL